MLGNSNVLYDTSHSDYAMSMATLEDPTNVKVSPLTESAVQIIWILMSRVHFILMPRFCIHGPGPHITNACDLH